MVKIKITDIDITIKVVSDSKTENFEIRNGVYNGDRYFAIIISSGVVALEGENDTVLKTNADAVFVSIKSIKQKIAELLNNSDVYVFEIDAIPEGQEREILQKLF